MGTVSDEQLLLTEFPVVVRKDLSTCESVFQEELSEQATLSKNSEPWWEEASGRAKKSINNAQHIMNFAYEVDLIQSCREKPGLNSLYTKNRPVVTGRYVPRRAVIIRADPHMTTFDGFDYTFIGLGVYNFMELLSSGLKKVRLRMEVSTRRIGDGTVFSGFAIEEGERSIQFHTDIDGISYLFINEEAVQIEQMSKRNKGGVMYRRNENATRLSFFLQDTQFAFAARFVETL